MSIWDGKSVFVTGHTGFKGGWLSLWLHHLGAKVHGYALNPSADPNLFEAAHIAGRRVLTSDTRSDIRNLDLLHSAIQKAQPEVVFHLAAQPLVQESYRDPVGTFTTNVMGTAHVLDAATDSVRAVVVVTTDKVYENREWPHPYRERDTLGGHDPYSASKAAAEIVTASYRSSYGMNVATARGGNVIGGGDWAQDRLVPDCLRAFEQSKPVQLRYPQSVRPWQHVLDALSGYLLLAEKLMESNEYATAWNFGPSDTATVQYVAQTMAGLWGDAAQVRLDPAEYSHEAGLLHLDSSRARRDLGWYPRWSVGHALRMTVDWHKSWLAGSDMQKACLEQIQGYLA